MKKDFSRALEMTITLDGLLAEVDSRLRGNDRIEVIPRSLGIVVRNDKSV